MRFDIRVQKLDLMQTVIAYIERRLRSSAGAFERYIHRVSVHLSDTNGPRGVGDKRCRITAHFGRHQTVIVEEVDSDPLCGGRSLSRANNTNLCSKVEAQPRPENRPGVGQDG